MKERPIIMSAESVRAILDGRKTMTRRVVKPQPDHCHWWKETGLLPQIGDREIKCPYGIPGDRLWVRETWCYFPSTAPDGMGRNVYYRASQRDIESTNSVMLKNEIRWRPSIYLPRHLSRINLEIVSVRVERVKDISYEDAVAEGIDHEYPKAWAQFRDIWDTLNAKRGYPWADNPYVWVIEFKVLP